MQLCTQEQNYTRKRAKKRREGNACDVGEILAFPEQGSEINGDGHTSTKKERYRKKTRRGKARRNALTKFKFLMNNVRGIKLKTTTIRRILDEEEPVMAALVETKLRKEDAYEIPGYDIARVDRDEEGGG